MIQRHHRLNAAGKQAVDQALVEAKTGRIDSARALRQHAPPGDAEAICLEAERGDEIQVAFPATVVIAGQIARVAVLHASRGVDEAMPDARPGAVGQG